MVSSIDTMFSNTDILRHWMGGDQILAGPYLLLLLLLTEELGYPSGGLLYKP
jgi:hypothetical protein